MVLLRFGSREKIMQIVCMKIYDNECEWKSPTDEKILSRYALWCYTTERNSKKSLLQMNFYVYDQNISHKCTFSVYCHRVFPPRTHCHISNSQFFLRIKRNTKRNWKYEKKNRNLLVSNEKFFLLTVMLSFVYNKCLLP